MKTRIASLFAVGFFLVLSPFGKALHAQGSQVEGIRCTISLSNQRVLPFKSGGVLVTLSNTTDEGKRVVASWQLFLYVGEVTAKGAAFQQYTPDREPIPKPPLPSAILVKPGESETWTAHLDFEALSGRHVFAKPGRYQIKASFGPFRSDAVDAIIEVPRGIDAKAYQFLQQNDLPKYFSERTVRKYPYDHNTVQSMEQFIKAYQGSSYSSMARLGLALMWIRGVEGKVDLQKSVDLLTQVSTKSREPISSQAKYYLGMAFQKQGKSDRARDNYQQILEDGRDPYFGYLAETALSGLPRILQGKP